MSLATKYRPKTFAEVIGQDKVIKSLKKVIADGRAHAFVFTGPSGCGKTTCARLLANGLAKTGHPTLIEIDAAKNTGVDAMREIVTRSHYRAVGASVIKAIIVDEAHRLSAAAWSTLLKPIEEPPEHVYWMICTTEADKIPKTIMTRCLRYDLRPVGDEQMMDLLCNVAVTENLTATAEVLEAVLDEAGGSPRQALTHLEVCAHITNVTEARSLMRSALQSKEAIDLCRFLMRTNGRSWAEAVKVIKGLEGVDSESVRITVANYLSKVLLGTADNRKAALLLGMLECFSTPYIASDKQAPLLLSVGTAIGLAQCD